MRPKVWVFITFLIPVNKREKWNQNKPLFQDLTVAQVTVELERLVPGWKMGPRRRKKFICHYFPVYIRAVQAKFEREYYKFMRKKILKYTNMECPNVGSTAVVSLRTYVNFQSYGLLVLSLGLQRKLI